MGIQETLDLIQALGTVGVALRRAVADGVQPTDVLLLVADPAVREALEAAATGAQQIPDEVADLDLREAGVLSQAALSAVQDVIDAGVQPAA
jgi:hypothetical protein